MTIKERIRDLANSKGLGLPALESELGFGNGTILKWDKSSPGMDKISLVADYFDVSVDYLLGRTAFRNPMELFEHWGEPNNSYFESAFDFGGLLKAVRETRGISQEEVSKALNMTVSDVNDIEDGILPLNRAWAEKYATFLGTTVEEIFIDNDMNAELNDIPLELLHYYQEQGMTAKEMFVAYTEFRQAEREDALKNDDMLTIAAHHDGEKWTPEELKKIEEYKQLLLAARSNKKQA